MNILESAKRTTEDLILFMYHDALRIHHDKYTRENGLQDLIKDVVISESMELYKDDIEKGVLAKYKELLEDKALYDEWFYSSYGKWLQRTYHDLIISISGEETTVFTQLFDKKRN